MEGAYSRRAMPAAVAPARSESLVSHHLNAPEENKVDLLIDSLTNVFQTVLLQQTVLSVRDLEAVARACKRMHALIGHLVDSYPERFGELLLGRCIVRSYTCMEFSRLSKSKFWVWRVHSDNSGQPDPADCPGPQNITPP